MKKTKERKDRAPLLARIFDPRMWLYDLFKILGFWPVLLDLRLKRVFVNPETKKGRMRGKYLAASNHVSYIDPVILFNVFVWRRICYVAVDELFKHKFWGPIFKTFGCIPISKENVSLETFKKIDDSLYRGHVVGVFPEGTVSQDNNMNAFKSGIVMMAVMSKADILPVYIVRRTNRWHRQEVLIGEKIILKEHISSEFPTMEEIENLTQLLKDRELELERISKERREKRENKKRRKQ